MPPVGVVFQSEEELLMQWIAVVVQDEDCQTQ
jgi:hypothetical protein